MDEPGVEVIHDGGNRVIDRQPPSVSGCAECRADGKFVALIHSTFRSLGLPALEETMLTLYTYFRSSAAFRVRIALNLKGLQWQPEVVWLPAGEQAGEAYLQANPQGLVPTLVEDGHHIAQSVAIIEYLDETHPQPPLLPGSPRDRARIRSLVGLIACDIHPINNLRILKYLKREMGQSQAAIDTWYRHWCHQGLAAYERQLGDGGAGKFSHGDQPTLADVCLVPQVFNARRYEVDMTAYPRVSAIVENCRALPAFQDAEPARQPEAARAPG